MLLLSRTNGRLIATRRDSKEGGGLAQPTTVILGCKLPTHNVEVDEPGIQLPAASKSWFMTTVDVGASCLLKDRCFGYTGTVTRIVALRRTLLKHHDEQTNSIRWARVS